LGFWVEVRPLSIGEFEPGNLKELLESLINSGRAFRIFIATSESLTVPEHKVVRYWIELPTSELKEYVARSLRTYFDVEVLNSEPPRRTYSYCTEFELRRHYAIPIWPPGQRVSQNPVDAIIEALATSYGAFEVTAIGDAGAKAGIYNYILEKLGAKGGFTREMMDSLLGIIAEIGIEQYEKEVGRQVWWKLRGRWRDRDPRIKAEIKAATRKLQQSLATCRVRVYGDQTTIQTVQLCIPSSANKLTRWKTKRNVIAPKPLKKPSKHRLRNLVAKFWPIASALTLFTAWKSGFFNPLRFGDVDVCIMAGIFMLTLLLAFTARGVRPVVLSAEELATFISLPTAIGRLPLELGVALPVRKAMPRGSQEETIKES
jgi:hypothetical protein